MMYPNSTAEKFSLVYVWLFGHRFLREIVALKDLNW